MLLCECSVYIVIRAVSECEGQMLAWESIRYIRIVYVARARLVPRHVILRNHETRVTCVDRRAKKIRCLFCANVHILSHVRTHVILDVAFLNDLDLYYDTCTFFVCAISLYSFKDTLYTVLLIFYNMFRII